MSTKIDLLIADFAKNLRTAIAEEAAAAFAVVAGGEVSPIARKGRARPAKGSARPANGKAKRRSPEDIEQQAAAILSFVRKHPASRAEAIGKAVGLTSIEMQIPIAQLFGEKKLVKKGERRATTYSAK